MPGNIEEKEKCLEKLNQMQKYLPFLDYMIDKIKKKNSEISLECQLSKFQLLRSMIAEKNGKSTWDVVVKAEDVIQKLISKLDFKDPNEKTKQSTDKTNMATSVSIVPPATTTASATTTTTSRTTTIDSKPQDTSTNTVNLIMKTLKISVDTKNKKDKGSLLNPLESVHPAGVSEKTLETDLDKDLDGFDLTDCPGLPGNESRSAGTVHVVPGKVSIHDDLLSSSREKLLKSLQSRLFPGGIPASSASSHVSRNEKGNEPQTSAFSRSQFNVCERKNKSDVSQNSENSAVDKNNRKDTPVKTTEKKSVIMSKPLKSGSSSDRSRVDSVNTLGDLNLKQKLKEKLSTDICEVYRVPGKSVGGSLRSLKESKEHKKSSSVEEEILFKPDIPYRTKSTEKKDNLGDKSRRNSTQNEGKVRKSDQSQSSQKDESNGSGSKKSDDKNCKTSHKDVKKSDSKSSKGEKKSYELSEVNDEELLGFVKDNVQSFPHLSKMKLPELKQAVQSSVTCKSGGLKDDEISEISDDSLQDLDEAVTLQNKNSKSDGKEKSESKEVGNPETKVGDLEDISGDESLNDEDYALKLIEDTTPKVQPFKKKKGLLELPMPMSSDLFKDISLIESFENFRSPTESKDPRLRRNLEVKKSNNDNKTESQSKTKEVSTSGRPNSQIPKVTSHSSKPPMDKKSQEKQYKKDQFTVESTEPFLRNPSTSFKPSYCNSSLRRHSQPSSEAKSYAEYKRRKLKEQEKAQRERSKSTDGLSFSDVSRSQLEKEDSGKNITQDPRRRDASNPPKYNNPVRLYENKKSQSCQDVKERRNSQEETKKVEDDKSKKSAEPEELISPLEELYRNENKPKTGRGYGIQHFKIPKKVVQSTSKSKKNSNSGKEESKLDVNITNEVKELEKQKEKKKEKEKEEVSQIPVVESTKVEEPKKSDVVLIDSKVPCKNDEKVESSGSSLKTEPILIEIESDNSSTVDSSENFTNNKAAIETNSEPELVTIPAETPTKSEVGLTKTDLQQVPKLVSDAEGKFGTTAIPKTVEETVKKIEPQIVECDSSVETSSLSDQTSGKDSATTPEKSPIVSKEEITQEFVEALIRKSFQSGEGKLLLAQVKLFEKFARKLNSKKLKTIQKIINSESDSSSSTSESSSEDEKKKKKGKKSEEKSRSKKKKKRGKNKRKRKSSPSSSSSLSESEESDEHEICDKKEEKIETRKIDSSVSSATVESEEISNVSEGSRPKRNESSGAPKPKCKKRRRNLEFLRNFGGKKAKRKQKQKKMLEKILNEGPQPETSNDSITENTSGSPAKEPEPKAKHKTKTKGKTELDRLHDDIRSMFISEGVVTATGQRMCRILKQSGGNINNLDIVKESAKMVEEEKLKKVQTRAPARNPRGGSTGSSENRSRSHSLDKPKSQQESEEVDPKLTSEPRVVLQNVDLNNFGYGVKISEDCISFRRMKGGNTAIRKTGIYVGEETTKNHSDSSLARNVFLSRNKRKFERLRDSQKRKSYRGKNLSEVVKHLPLKMAKMKHLQICKKKGDESNVHENSDGEHSVVFSDSELLKYAFDKKQEIYSCKLCSCITRNITGHYKVSHPESEVLISRLNVQEAKRAKLEAKKHEFEEEQDEERSLAASMKRKVKALLNRTFLYHCRMCHCNRVTDVNAFASHVSIHTGEYRYKCPSEDCTVHRYSQDDIKFHILTKHPRYKNELTNKISELYELTIEDGNMFGFLCSKCNFVQICRSNVEKHISIQHKKSENISIIKINMSGKAMGPMNKRKLRKNSTTAVEMNRKSKTEPERPPLAIGKENDEQESSKRKRHSEDEREAEVKQPEKKKLLMNKTPEVVGSEEKPNEKTEIVAEENGGAEDGSALDTEDCSDLSIISELKESVQNPKRKGSQDEGEQKAVELCRKLKVGPLEAQLFKNTEVLYECYVKGCLFSTRAFYLFLRHIKISHLDTKWNGICEICCSGKDAKSQEDLNFKLLNALKHLKLHELQILHKANTEDDLVIVNDEEFSHTETKSKEPDKEKNDKEGEIQNNLVETSYPVRPLLRVRNFLGDRLSTPKADDNLVERGTEDSNGTKPSTMFTIEDVRSLTEVPAEGSGLKIEQVCSLKEPNSGEETELKIGQVCSLQDQILKSGTQLGHEKAIIVRSCPTRTIPIRPKLSALQVDVGQVVRPPALNHSVMLNSISPNPSIQLIPAAGNSYFNADPVLISNGPSQFGGCVMPVNHPGMSSVAINQAVPKGPRTKRLPRKIPEGKGSVEIDRIKSPSGSLTTQMARSSSPDREESEKKDTAASQRFQTNPGTGKKCVKDAKIYQEMLTKKKLSHLFKCMGVECSFTTNNEQVFTQHIGLHEAQRRLQNSSNKEKSKSKAQKTMDAFYWQQCAYCCEVLNNTKSALSQHVIEEHGHCMYQCAFCFYRAISHNYVEIHQNIGHSQILKMTPRLIYKCKPLKAPPSHTAVLEKHGKRQSVRPYHCDQCGRNFFITQDFTCHLATEHQSVTAYTCHICKNLCFKVNRLINHYKLHSYSMYQCAYCLHGTETEKEMVFHLSNFHFSQPPVMYVRTLADGQKHQNHELDSLRVIVYESDSLNADCVVEVEPDEEITETPSSSTVDLSAIVEELGINTDAETSSSPCVTPLMQELASIGDKSAKNLTVKTLLPNAQFSSENESGTENCSVLISSGLSIPSDQNNEKDMSIPLGQLPLESVNVQHKEPSSPTTPPPIVSPPDKNLKLNEILVNHYCKSLPSTEEEITKRPDVALSSAVHKLPPVVLSRSSTSKSSYPSKCAAIRKKSEEQIQNESAKGNKEPEGNRKIIEKAEGDAEKEEALPSKRSTEIVTDSEGTKTTKPLITDVVSLTNNEFDKKETTDDHIVITKICSLSDAPKEIKDSGQGVGSNRSLKTSSPPLEPPIIRVEDFPIDENITRTPSVFYENPPVLEKFTEQVEKFEEKKEDRPSSPDVIILEDQKAKDIVTVTIDSDEEKGESVEEEPEKDQKNSPEKDDKIRKEMDVLRKQMASETDSLLSEEGSEAEKPMRDLSLNIQLEDEMVEESKEKSLLSPLEEAICSLNKKLQSETEEAQKKEEEEKKEKDEGPKKTDECENLSDRPRTRFGTRDRRKEGGEGSEKSEGDETRKDEVRKGKRCKRELVGKDLFICGNEKCTFAADDDVSLKDHLYVCDLFRESSVLFCRHCSRQIKQFHAYLEHLRYHGEKKFHCGLCSFSSAVDISTSRHVKQKHKCSAVKILPKESKEGHLVYYPKSYKLDKFDFKVNGYSPGDEGKLPPQSVYHVNVKCAKCPYFTKVRSNMVRHLKIHVKSAETEGVVVVPSTAPTNPVPCLETKERMFDKMTNLAASSQLAQAKEKTAVESLSPEEEAKLPQFVTEQMRYKCCLPDCNYITVDEGMLRHHIKALHNEINYYSCPHCKDTVHADVRHVTLDKIGHHLKHHDSKLYKCAHCIYFHYQKNVVEKHTVEKHPDKRYFVHTVREPKPEIPPEEESSSSSDGGSRVWKCALCDEYRTPSKPTLMDHLLKSHNTKSKYKCQLCSMKGNSYQAFSNHFLSKHPGEKTSYVRVYHSDIVAGLESQSGNSSGADSSNEHFDTTPLWQRGAPRIRHIRGILIEEEEIKTKKSKRISVDESEGETSDTVKVKENVFHCPLCTNKKKPFYTRNEDCFRTHLYQELNYQQFACILCGKMFVDKKDFERHHTRVHGDKPQALKQTKEDHEIKFWVDQVIAKRKKQMGQKKRKMSESEKSERQEGPPKKKKEV